MTPDDGNFFGERREWSRRKHEILDKYLHVWVSKLGSIAPELAFVDTCAGPGRYETGELGSPLLAASWNERFCHAHGSRLVVHACERRRADAAKLRENLREYSVRTPPEAFVYAEPFAEALPTIHERTRHIPTLIFVDPYGMGGITADVMRALIGDKRRKRLEVMVRVDPVLLQRFAGWIRDEPEGSDRWKRTAAGFERLLANLNIDPGELRRSPHARSRDALMAAYLQIFRDRFDYVQLIPIRASYHDFPKYFLVHGTDSPHGAAKINDVFSTSEDSMFAEAERARDGLQRNMFEAEPRPLRATIDQAKDSVLEVLQFSPNQTARFVSICAELALTYGPDLREKDYKRAVTALLREGRITVDGGPPIKDGSWIRGC